jgi:hypothetical protein
MQHGGTTGGGSERHPPRGWGRRGDLVTTTTRRLLGVMLIGALVLAACGGDDSDGTPGAAKGQSTGATLRVPGDYATIQAAVDDAEPGDLILVGPGT